MLEGLLGEVADLCGPDDRLCLLPLSRVMVEDAAWISERIAVFPPDAIPPEMLRVVEWPARRLSGMRQLIGDGGLALSGDALHWGKSAATNIDLPEFFGSALLAFPAQIDWPGLLTPESHEAHLELLRAQMEGCERILDLVRFEQCNLWTPQALPGRVGLLENTAYCAGLFYSRADHESYLIAGEIVTHQLIVGLGTDLSGVFVAPIPAGELGALATHALRLFTDALEAQTETSRFVQLMSLVEFLADPNGFTKMQDARKAVGRQIARDRADYEAIQRDFHYLATEPGPVDQPKRGLRHNIVHLGKRLEDLTTPSERRELFQRLSRYVGVPISQMIKHGDKDWSFIDASREEAKDRLGLG